MIDAAPGVTFGFHLCKGNQDSRWLVAGGYGDIAKPVFEGVRAHRLLLEYDDERSGGFEPLALVPDDRVVVLGPGHDQDGAAGGRGRAGGARDRGGARFVDLDRLAISPQCGFSTSVVGNALGLDDQRRKLELCVRVAERVWG